MKKTPTDKITAQLYLTSALILLCLLFFLTQISDRPLLDNNEGLYAAIARDMISSGNWIIPHFNGVAYMEKPPLLYWAMAVAMMIFGEHAWAARLPSVLAGIATLCSVAYWVTQQTSKESGCLTGVILASMLGYAILNQIILFDPLLTLWLTLALCFAWNTLEGEAAKAQPALVFLALAILTKGFVALILFGGLVMISAIMEKRYQHCLYFLRLKPLALFFLVVAPWHILAILNDADFAWFYFINEHVLRFLGQRTPHDYYGGPWWYYLPRIILGALPWSLFILLIIWSARLIFQQAWARFSLVVFLVPLLFFSLSTAKANYYLMISLPWLAILIGQSIEKNRVLAQRVWPFFHLITGLLILTLPWVGWHQLATRGAATTVMIILANGIALLVIIGGFYLSHGTRWFASGLLSLSLLWPVFTLLKEPTWHTSSAPALATIQQTYPNAPLLLYGRIENVSAMAFYRRTPWPLVESTSQELYFGQRRGERADLFLDTEQALALLRSGALLLVSEKELKKFQQSTLAPALHLRLVKDNIHVFSLG